MAWLIRLFNDSVGISLKHGVIVNILLTAVFVLIQVMTTQKVYFCSLLALIYFERMDIDSCKVP